MRFEPIVPPPPAITLDEAKTHCRIDGPDEDALVEAIVTAAGAHVERIAGRAFGAQEWLLHLDAFPSGLIAISRSDIVSVLSVDYVDADGVDAIVPAADYSLSLSEAGGILSPAAQWPAGSSVAVRVAAGRGWTEEARQAVRLLTCYWYDMRSAGGEKTHEAPLAFSGIVGSLRRMSA